jgi:hypothetical protein
VQVNFVPFEERDGKGTTVYLDGIRDAIKGIPSTENQTRSASVVLQYGKTEILQGIRYLHRSKLQG